MESEGKSGFLIPKHVIDITGGHDSQGRVPLPQKKLKHNPLCILEKNPQLKSVLTLDLRFLSLFCTSISVVGMFFKIVKISRTDYLIAICKFKLL